MYESGKPPSRLGRWEQLGQTTTSWEVKGGEVAAVISAVNQGVIGVIGALEGGKTTRRLSQDQRDVALASIRGQVEMTETRAEAEVAESHDVVKVTDIKYAGSTKIILALGIALAGIILVSGVAVGMTKKPKRK